ncbi:MAG: response regulator, partial [Saprospiraceae bacterium]
MTIKASITIFLFLATKQLYAINVDSLSNAINRHSGNAKGVLLCKAASVLMNSGQIDDAQKFATQALEIASKTGSQIIKAKALQSLGLVCQEKNNLIAAQNYLTQSLEIYEFIKDHGAIASLKLQIGGILLTNKDYIAALTQFTQSYEYYKAEKNSIGMAESAGMSGKTYAEMKVYGKAKDNYERSLSLFLNSNEIQKAAENAHKLGEILSEMSDYDGAIMYFQKAYELYAQVNNQACMLQNAKSLAKSHLVLGNFQQTQEFAADANAISILLRDTLSQVETQIFVALSSPLKLKKSETVEILHKSAELLRKCTLKLGKDNVYAQLALAFHEIGEADLAYQYMKEMAKVKDELYILSKYKFSLDLVNKYDAEYKAKKNQLKNEVLSIQKNDLYFKIFAIFLLIVAGATFAWFWNKYRKQLQISIERSKILQIELLSAQNEKAEQESEICTLKSNNAETIEQLRILKAKEDDLLKERFERDNFLVNICQQLQSPLLHTSTLTHALLSQTLKKDQKEQIRKVQFANNAMYVLINDLLEFSDIETGKLLSESIVFDTAAVWKEIKDRYHTKLQKKGLVFNFNLYPGIPLLLLGDPAVLIQILCNLLDYCQENTSSGAINVKVEAIPLNNNSIKLEIIVSDSSFGIPQYRMDEFLKKYFYHEGRPMENTASIAGLSYMKRLVQLQNGTVEASSIEGMGNRFRIVVPMRIAGTKVIPMHATSQTIYFPGSKILVVEDNKINAMVLVKLLQNAFTKVSTAENGKIALQKVKEENFDLILMDIQMPEMDGFQATKEIRKLENEIKKNIPVIALTSAYQYGDAEKAAESGMNDFVRKPFSTRELVDKISRFLTVEEKNAAG